MTACMGGWCARRDYCSRYMATDVEHPVERLCVAGNDGMVPVADAMRLVFHKPAGTWERRADDLSMLARPNPMQVVG